MGKILKTTAVSKEHSGHANLGDKSGKSLSIDHNEFLSSFFE